MKCFVLVFGLLVLGGNAAAQSIGVASTSITRAAGQLRPTSGAPTSAARSAATTLQIQSRARKLGSELSGSGTRYFFVGDRDIRAAADARAVRELLAGPVIGADDLGRTRRVEAAVELRFMTRVEALPGEPVRIGTVAVDPEVRRLQVRTVIFAPNLVVESAR